MTETKVPQGHITLSGIPLEELLHDRQECYNELAAIAIAKAFDGYMNPALSERAEKNLSFLKKIHAEMNKRGIEPGVYQP